MTETMYAVAAACLCIAAYQFGKRRAFKKLKIENKTPLRIDIDVFPDETKIVIKSINQGESK